ncbi:uncharacterized protein UTRI_06637 [Ustilago trichophora]|uniref:Uncharacterized protein n=1 Tax=Ustilago trichophora TaxID=86804 RepID=A0A5C3ENW8_9BASI|nr:uncharacterized protein UTRI_06637 [Ustilago trichophora]
MEIDEAKSGRRPHSASDNSGLATSSRQEHQLDRILSDFLAQSKDEVEVFRLNLTGAFNKTKNLKDRLYALDSCLKAPVLESLVSTLGQRGDDLPPKFMKQVFHMSTSPPVIRPYNSTTDIIKDLDKKQLNRADKLQCLLSLFQCAYRTDASRQTVNVVRTTPTVNFNDRFYGDGLLLLESHITIHNNLFHIPSDDVSTGPVHTEVVGTKKSAKTPNIARHYYSKVLPIIQSSGFGKTRTCVQLSTNSPGMLVCLRSSSTDSPYHDSDYVSFPPQDSEVFKYFAKHNNNYQGNEKPTTETAHQQFNLVHLVVLAWLSAYCRAIAFYLAYLKRLSPACFSARRMCTSDPQLCWSTVVFQLANAIHTSDFIPHRLFRERAMCPNNDLVKIFSHNRDPPKSFLSQERRQQQEEQKAQKEQEEQRKRKRQKEQGEQKEQVEQKECDPPHLYCTQNLRTQLLKHICEDAKRINALMLKAYSGRLFYEDLLLDAISDFLRENLHSLEDSTPNFANQPFFFWPSTNADLWPTFSLSYIETAREVSRRMNPGGTHLLTQPFSTMPLDVNFPPAYRQDVFGRNCKLTFKELNQMLPRLGRPLWYDVSYRHQDGTIKPREIMGKLVIPHWMWDYRGGSKAVSGWGVPEETRLPPAPPAPTTQPAASAVTQAESAPAALAVEQDDPFLQLVDPALLMDEQALAPTSDLDSSREDSPLALVDDNLDFVFAEADAETAAAAAAATQEPAAEDVEMHDNFHNNFQEDASSGEVLDPFPIPSLDLPAADKDNLQEGSEAGSEAGLEAETLEQEEDTGETLPQLPLQEVQAPQPQQLELDVPDMPEDGIVVLLPSMDSPTGPVPNLLLDSHAAEEPPMLPPIPGLSPITDWNVGVDTDVDSFAVTISPADILKIFPAGCYLSLISHAPDFKDLASFNSWVYFAELKVLFRFEPQFKLPLIQRLCQAPQKAILIPSEYATALTLGELRLDVGIVVEALQDIGCQNVRMGAYGIKVPVDRFLDPAMLSEHPMRESNVFDIGCTIDTGRVTLIAPKSKKGKYKQYPMALRVGRGFGSVELKWSSRTDGITHFKGYPKLTHLLKAGAAGAGQAGVPMTVKTVKDRISTLESWKQRIIGTAPELGSGVRLEVTVQAATMQQARAAAEASQRSAA